MKAIASLGSVGLFLFSKERYDKKEEVNKMVRKIMSITIAVALVLAQASIASAYVSDDIYGVAPAGQTPIVQGPAFTAEKDFSGVTSVADLTVSLKKRADDTADTQIGWVGVTLQSGWKKADQYLEVVYAANQIGWGVQIYTDNTSATATKPYTKDLTKDPFSSAAGLIAQGANQQGKVLPMALLVYDGTVADAVLQVPVENTGFGTFKSGIDTDSDSSTGDADTGAEWFWFFLKDKSDTTWDDKNDNQMLDIDVGTYGDLASAYEVIPDFNPNGEPQATIINGDGIANGRLVYDVDGTTVILDKGTAATSPVIIYVAVDFATAGSIQNYHTNTLSIELYHQ